MVEVIRAIILFADIHGSTEFGYSQPIGKYNEMLRDFHKTCHKAIEKFRRDEGLAPDRVMPTCRGDECCAFLRGGKPPEDELLAMRLAIYLKEMWRQSRFCRLTRKAAGLIPQVDLRIGIGSGEVALDHDVWSGSETLEGIRISEAKRIEGMADAASDTLIMVKLDIMEACVQAREKVEFGPRLRLQGKGVPDVVETAVYPVKTYAEWEAIQKKIVPSPKTYFERFGRALALRRSGDVEAALKEYSELLKQRPDDPNTLTNRGNFFYDLQRYDEALADYNRSLELRPDHPGTLRYRGTTLCELKRYEEALADYNRSLELRPDNPGTLYNRGITLGRLNRYGEALADYNRSLELRPDNPGTFNNRGNTLDALKRYEEALADFNRSLELRPDHPDTLNNRGAALDDLGRYEEALADYNRSLELRPDHPDTLNNRGITLCELKRYEEALADFNRSLELRPDDPGTLNNRGLALDALKRYEEALADYNRSLELEPHQSTALYNRACYLSLTQRYEEALPDLRQAIACDAKYQRMAREDEDFEGLGNDPEWGPEFWELVGTEDQP